MSILWSIAKLRLIICLFFNTIFLLMCVSLNPPALPGCQVLVGAIGCLEQTNDLGNLKTGSQTWSPQGYHILLKAECYIVLLYKQFEDPLKAPPTYSYLAPRVSFSLLSASLMFKVLFYFLFSAIIQSCQNSKVV